MLKGLVLVVWVCENFFVVKVGLFGLFLWGCLWFCMMFLALLAGVSMVLSMLLKGTINVANGDV